MKKRFALAALGLVIVIAVLGGTKALQIGDLIAAGEDQKPPPTSITSAEAGESDWETTIRAIGTLEAAQGVIITADTPGRVTALRFDGGEVVKKGDLLVEQDTSTERAELDAAKANLQLAQSDLERSQRLFESKTVSRADFDSATSQLNSAKAQVQTIRSNIAKKRIVAPFDGRLGLRLVNVGQDLTQGVSIVSLQNIDTMRVNFSLPQQQLANIEIGYPARITSSSVPGRKFDGKITAIDTQIDNGTRTVRVQARIDNPEGQSKESAKRPALLPGMFASVQVVMPDARQVLTIPQTSVSFATYGDSVFIIEKGDDDNQVARQQFVQLGERRGDFVEVIDGLKAGQTVASNGVFKLRNGATVMIDNEGKPEPKLDPNPDNA